jgi:NAD(P)-dependent dehydrogenase (short-subunit alcohol dehydrogenase family)
MALLDGKVAIITGAGAGIGRGVALAFASEGAAIAATLADVCAEIEARGTRAVPVVCDVRELADIEQLLERTVAEFGRLDVLVNNAQTYRHAALLDATEDDFETTMRSGPLAVFRSMRLAHPHLKATRGVVVNFGSGVQLDPSESFHGVYFAAKNAIEAFTRAAAVEWGADGIRTMLIMPAAESPQLRAFEARDPARFQTMLGRIPLGRFGDAEADIGRTIAWLVSEHAQFMTGCTFMLDGGQMYLR